MASNRNNKSKRTRDTEEEENNTNTSTTTTTTFGFFEDLTPADRSTLFKQLKTAIESSIVNQTILSEVRQTSAQVKSLHESVGQIKEKAATVEKEVKLITINVTALATARQLATEQEEANGLTKEELKHVQQINSEMWWNIKEDQKEALAIRFSKDSMFMNNPAKIRACMKQSNQWFSNKRSNFKASIETKAPAYFLKVIPPFDNEEALNEQVTAFTMHLLNNKRRHTANDVEHVTKLLRAFYNPTDAALQQM